MLPKSVLITNLLATEYEVLLEDAILVKTEYQKSEKLFLFSFKGRKKYLLEYSFAPPKFYLSEGWRSIPDLFEIWQECAGASVEGVNGDENNRIIRIRLCKSLEDGSSRKFTVLFELLGALTNAFLIDEKKTILQALRIVSDPRKLRPRSKYAEPPHLASRETSGRNLLGTLMGTKHFVRSLESRHEIESESGEIFAPRSETPLVMFFQEIARQQEASGDLEKKKAQVTGLLQSQLKKTQTQLKKLQKSLAESQEAGKYKQWADILMANPHAKPNGEAVRVFDFYHDIEIEIPIFKANSLVESAERYYKLAGKLQRAPGTIRPQMAKLEAQAKKLNQQIKSISGISSIEELQDYLLHDGLTKARTTKSDSKATEATSKFYRIFFTPSGERILVGKSATGNDHLTFKVARSYDLWFHSQQSAGSHVVLVVTDKNKKPSKSSITLAAELAAYYSDMRKSRNVPVVFTERRHVRKAKGNVPGKVITDRVTSLFVDPALPPQFDVDSDA